MQNINYTRDASAKVDSAKGEVSKLNEPDGSSRETFPPWIIGWVTSGCEGAEWDDDKKDEIGSRMKTNTEYNIKPNNMPMENSCPTNNI